MELVYNCKPRDLRDRFLLRIVSLDFILLPVMCSCRYKEVIVYIYVLFPKYYSKFNATNYSIYIYMLQCIRGNLMYLRIH